MRFDKLNDLFGWVIFLIASVVYLMTIEPTVSLWDCGEYIAISNKLEIGHPPGAPFFMLVARVFSAFVAKEDVAMMVNSMSALCSAFAILFLFWSITAILRRIGEHSEEGMAEPQKWGILASAFLGALAFTFTDTFWFSAVEGEVYAMSAMFTAAVFWLILKWERRADEPHNERYILLIAFIIGLSIGVHLMNILAIPAIALVYYFRKFRFSVQGLISALAISGGVIILFQVVVITGIFEWAGWFERVMVNQAGAPFNLGAAIYFVLLFLGIIAGIHFTQSRIKPLWSFLLLSLALAFFGVVLLGYFSGSVLGFILVLLLLGGLFYAIINAYYRPKPLPTGNLILLALTVILLGYSSYTMILIRSAADPPIDENNPENLLTLVSYLKREQYGSRPIFYGQYWNAPVEKTKSRGKSYMKGYQVKDRKKGKTLVTYQSRYDAEQYMQEHSDRSLKIHPAYVAKKERTQKVFNDKWTVPFQRMYDHRHASDYKNWVDPRAFDHVQFTNRRGESDTRARPEWWQNLDFYFEYQLGWMYGRYFLWNFAGRQNDEQGFAGSLLKGNWLSGIDMIDSKRLGSQDGLPATVYKNDAYNHFYYLPLILGLIGFFYQLVRAPKSWTVILVLFLITGIAIVTYLNQPPHEPRERDYTNVGSFWTFAIWIGIGVYALFDMARNLRMPQLREILTWGGGSVGVILIFSLLMDSGQAFSFSLVYFFVVAFLAIGVMYAVGNLTQNRYAHVLIAFLVAAPVPYVLAKEGWDNHDRSDRYSARDYAKNYLESCEKNAVLFTNGDNDTFPLWYVQEVEEFRTDVRVVNLSLLNTDWYIDQMSRKAYDSEGVPFAGDEETPRKNRVNSRKYRQGNRDMVFLFETGHAIPQQAGAANKIVERYGSQAFHKDTSEGAYYLDVDAAVDFMMNDENKFRPRGRGEEQAYFPSKRFFIDVPKEKIRKKDMVPEEREDEIVDRIQWRIGQRRMTKNHMMVMCLLAHFDWERPIYFSVTVGGKASLGLKDYLQLEGLAYRLVPVKGKNSAPAVDGGVHTDKMYHNIMNEFHWGNIDSEKDLYMDVDTRRMTSNIRLQFANLASQLNSEGKKDSAKKLLEHSLEVLPEHNVPYDRLMVMVVKELFKAGGDEKAEEIARDVFSRYERTMRYLTTLSSPFRGMQQVSQKKREAQYVLRSLAQLAQKYGSKELKKDLKERAKPYMPQRRRELPTRSTP